MGIIPTKSLGRADAQVKKCMTDEVAYYSYNSHIDVEVLAENNLPSTVHWLNFSGEDTVNRIGLDKIKQAPFQEVNEVGSDYFLKLKEYPFDDFSSEDVALQVEVNRFLGLSD